MSMELVKKYRVALCVASGDLVNVFWAHDFARMVGWTTSTAPDVDLMTLVCTGSQIVQQRNTLLTAVLEDGGFTHALWTDTDMRYPKDTLLRLMAYEAPIVCANYTKRQAPFEPVARDASGAPVYTEHESGGLQEVAGCGFGVMLLDVPAVKGSGIKPPYFMVPWNPNTGKYMSEDHYFCFKATEKGLPVMIDQDLSKEVAHVGRLELTYEHALRQRDAAGPEES
jgi:hypothetical protein